MTPDELIAHACPKIGALGGAFYFRPETIAVGKEHGLDGFRFYFLGRGGVLGDVEPAVVLSAFGYFEAGLLAKMWNTAKEKVAPREAARIYLQCNAELGRTKFSGIDELDAFNAAAEKIVAAAHPAALPLFAGIAAEPLPDDAAGRAIQLVSVLREMRGSAHLAAIVASGLHPTVAHHLKRPDDMESFGYRGDPPAVTDEDRAKHQAAEAMTDAMVRPAYAAVTPEEADLIARVLDKMEAALA